jgi:parvulin-like peptidyl-prolyl isomerase
LGYATRSWSVVLWMSVCGLFAVGVACGAPGDAAVDLTQPVATVNGRAVTRADLYRRLEQTGGERVLADLLARLLIEEAFDAAGLKLGAEEANAAIAKMKAQAPNEAEWQAFLTQQGMAEMDLREAMAFSLKVKRLAEKDVDVSEAAVRRFFDEHPEQFGRPETVVLSEIVVRDEAKARRVRALIKTPTDFARLAREQSVAVKTREQGGVRPEEALADLRPEALREAVAALAVGRVSQPIQADDGWRLVRLDQRHPAETADFAQIQERVREAYLAVNARKVPDLLEELRKTAQINIVDPRYQGLSRMFGPPAQ